MTANEIQSHRHVLSFWFGALDEHGLSAPEVRKRWFSKSEHFDETVTREFLRSYEALVAERRDDQIGEFSEAPSCTDTEACVAEIILLDQMPRNMFRGTARMYAADDLALAVAERLLPSADALPAQYAAFAIMPLMHAEDLEAQDRCVALFESLAENATSEPVRESFQHHAKFARDHRDVVARFGRFPHRNSILGRESTPEEAEYLSQPDAGW